MGQSATVRIKKNGKIAIKLWTAEKRVHGTMTTTVVKERTPDWSGVVKRLKARRLAK